MIDAGELERIGLPAGGVREVTPAPFRSQSGVGNAQQKWLQSVNDAFPFETAVDPGGVGAVVGEKEWLW